MGSFYVIHDYWNAALVSIAYVSTALVSFFTSICIDLGSFCVIQDDWNAYVTILDHLMFSGLL